MSALLDATLTTTTPSPSVYVPKGDFAMEIAGTFTGSVTLQRARDNATWIAASRDSAGTAMTYTAPTPQNCRENEGAYYRFLPNLSSGAAVVHLGNEL
jgi:hypothetical protein